MFEKVLEKEVAFSARSMGMSTKIIKVKPSDIKQVKDHPSCWRLSILVYKNGGMVTVECSPSKTKEKLGL